MYYLFCFYLITYPKWYCRCWICMASRYQREFVIAQTKSPAKKTPVPFLSKYQFDGRHLLSPLFLGANTTRFEAIANHLYIFSTNHAMSKMYLTDVLKTDSPTILFIFQHHIRRRKNWSNISLFQIYKYNVCVNDCVV